MEEITLKEFLWRMKAYGYSSFKRRIISKDVEIFEFRKY